MQRVNGLGTCCIMNRGITLHSLLVFAVGASDERILPVISGLEWPVYPARTLYEGLDVCRASHENLVVVIFDNVPTLSGTEVLEGLSSSPIGKKLPKVIVTSDPYPERFLVAGADEILDRNQFSDEAMRHSIRLAIQRHAIQSEIRKQHSQTLGQLTRLGDNIPRGAVYQVHSPVGGKGRFTYFSAGIEDMFGVTPSALTADSELMYRLIVEEDRAAVEVAERQAAETLTALETEFRQRTVDGEVKWVQVRAMPEKLPDGSLLWNGVVIDITDRKLIEQALTTADRRKDEFLATLAHELRNPLAPLRTGLELLRRTAESAATLQVHQMMERQLTHLVRLVDDLLDVSRITRGKAPLRKSILPLKAIIQSALETSRPGIMASKHSLSVSDVPDDVWIDGDHTRLSQVLSNLLNNAAKYTPEGGRISVAFDSTPSFVKISVADNGVGIAPEMLPLVFDMFAQADRTLERSQGGLGIGLTLVRTLVEAHGGSVTAESPGLGKGSMFTVTLPRSAAPPSLTNDTVTTSRIQASPLESKMHRILVVDDNADGANALSRLLTVLNHDVRCAYSGLEAVDTAREFTPEIVLCDIGLPGMNGYDVAREIRKMKGCDKAVLVAVTGWGTDEDRARTSAAGYQYHLTKPVEFTAVCSILDEAGSRS